MDALNKQERTEAFLKMLAFFILAIIVIAIPMYYAFSLPEKEKTLHQAECDSIARQLEDINAFVTDFKTKADSAIALFNRFKEEPNKVQRDKLRLKFSEVTNQMENAVQSIKNDPDRAKLYNDAIFVYSNLFSTWSDKFELKEELNNTKKNAQAGAQQASTEQKKEMTIREKEIDLIQKTLEKHNGDRKAAAKELGTSERKLKRRMKELGIG